MTAEERLQPVHLHPEMASLTTGTVNFGDEIFANPWPMVREFAQVMADCGVKAEFEIFDGGMVGLALRLHDEGLVAEPLCFDLVLGVRGGMPATARSMVYLVDSLPPGAHWLAAGIGRAQTAVAAMAIAMGGHVRVGLEDNIYYRRGELARSNAQLVARVARIAAELDRPLATPQQAREMIGLLARL
jgi:3-keto-5-aminohexanoate cleavage enzyme